MSAKVDIEAQLFTELGEDGAKPCEHSQHTFLTEFHEDGNEHYVMANSPCGHGITDDVFIVCEKWLTTSDVVSCGECGIEFPIREHTTDLGLVSNFHK